MSKKAVRAGNMCTICILGLLPAFAQHSFKIVVVQLIVLLKSDQRPYEPGAGVVSCCFLPQRESRMLDLSRPNLVMATRGWFDFT